MIYRHPGNSYEEQIYTGFSWLWVILFGPLYWIVRGVWTHALASFILAVCTAGLSWLVYPFFTYSILRHHYNKMGWVPGTPSYRP